MVPAQIISIVLYCHETNFMSNLHKSKRADIFDMLSGASRYLDDIPGIHHR